MIYKDHEIYARVWQSGSTLYNIDKKGFMTDEIEGCEITHNDQQIVWYEVEAIDPKSGTNIMHIELDTLEDAKKIVDESIKYTKQFV